MCHLKVSYKEQEEIDSTVDKHPTLGWWKVQFEILILFALSLYW